MGKVRWTECISHPIYFLTNVEQLSPASLPILATRFVWQCASVNGFRPQIGRDHRLGKRNHLPLGKFHNAFVTRARCVEEEMKACRRSRYGPLPCAWPWGARGDPYLLLPALQLSQSRPRLGSLPSFTSLSHRDNNFSLNSRKSTDIEIRNATVPEKR